MSVAVNLDHPPMHTRPSSQPTPEQAALLRAKYRRPIGRGSPVNRGLARELGASAYMIHRWAVDLGLDVPYPSEAHLPQPAPAHPKPTPLHAVAAPVPHPDPLDENGQPILSQELKNRISAREQAREVVRDFMANKFPEILQRAIDEAAHRIAHTALRTPHCAPRGARAAHGGGQRRGGIEENERTIMLDPIATAARYLDLCDLEASLTEQLVDISAQQDDGVDIGNLDLETMVKHASARGARKALGDVLGLDTSEADDQIGLGEIEPPPACTIPTVELVPNHPGCYLLSGPANDAAGIQTAEWHALLTEEQLVQLAVALVAPLATHTAQLRERQRTGAMRPHNRWLPEAGEADRLTNCWVIQPNGSKTYRMSPLSPQQPEDWP